MIKHYIIYKKSGEIIRSGTCPTTDFDLQAQDGELIIEGIGSARNNYITDDTVMDLPTKPGEHYFFDYESKNWILDESSLILDIKTVRNKLLLESDWTDTVSAQTRLSNYDDWQTYRQALRDVTLQTGFPIEITWPTRPE